MINLDILIDEKTIQIHVVDNDEQQITCSGRNIEQKRSLNKNTYVRMKTP